MGILRLSRRVARMPGVWRLRARQQLARLGVREETFLIVLAVVIGLGAAGAGWLFEATVHLLQVQYFERLAAAGQMTTRRLWLLPLLPAAGGLALSGVRWLFGRSESKLHGLSSVMMTLIRNRGHLDPRLGLSTLLTSGLTIGTGGSAGPEAPIAIIGSSVGSIVSNLAGISRQYSPTLIGCGAAAGISAVFDAPIAGVLFALEVMLRDFSVRTFTPIVISAVIATTAFHGLHHHAANTVVRGLFEMPTGLARHVFEFYQMPHYVLFGLLSGLLAVAFTRAMSGVEHLCERLRGVPRWAYPAIGAGLSGVCGVILILALHDHPALFPPGRPYVPIFAGGYPTVLQAIDPASYNGHVVVMAGWVAAFLCLLKVLATALTLGSGGSGGVFAPSIFIGATAGGAFAMMLRQAGLDVEPSAYALVGVGTVLAAMIQAPLMGIILLFELTRDYQIMLPAMLAIVTATLVYQFFVGESLYTLPLKAMGVRLGAAVGVGALRRVGVDQMALKPAPVARPAETLTNVLRRSESTGATDFVVLDEHDEYLGLLTLDDLRSVLLAPEAAPLLLVGEVLRSDVPPLDPRDTLETALERFARHEVSHLAVMENTPRPRLQGLLSRADVMKRYHAALL